MLGEDGNPVATGEPGEICLQGPCMMDGYWNQPELTAETIVDGWVHTGDMATCDDDGFLTIVDRKKDMIVSGGFNVFPREIEDVLTTHPAVAGAAVIGVPDDKWGEAVTALVVVRPGQEVSPDELIALVRERKGPIAAPKTVEFIDTIPLTPVGKADKRDATRPLLGRRAAFRSLAGLRQVSGAAHEHLEPGVGIEPTTTSLQEKCSAN